MSTSEIAPALSSTREHGEPTSLRWQSRALDLSKGFLFYLALLLPVLLVAIATGVRVLVVDGDGKAWEDKWLAIGVVVACFVPSAFMLTIPLLMKQTTRRLIATQLPFEVGATPDSPEAVLHQRVYQRVAERCKQITSAGEVVTDRIMRHAYFYAALVPLALLVSVLLTGDSFAKGRPGESFQVRLGYAIGTATLVSFADDLSRMVYRAAKRDGSTQMFAWAARKLLITFVGTCLLCLLVWMSSNAADGSGSATGLRQSWGAWSLMGAAMAVGGQPALEATLDRVAPLIGISRRRLPADNDLRKLNGLSENDLDRLAEEGIDSIQNLAYASTMHLFLATNLPFVRICALQDECLLTSLVGTSRATIIRERTGVNGALAFRRLLTNGNQAAKTEVIRLLGVADAAQDAFISELARNQRILELEVLSETVSAHR